MYELLFKETDTVFSFPLILCHCASTKRRKTISGHVRDSQDLPLAGVNIKVKNTPYGAISNEKGEYVLKGQWEPGVSIEFSFIGMKRKVVTYKGQTRLDVTLLDDVNNMDEVVVTAKANINEIDIRARSGVVQEVDMRRTIVSRCRYGAGIARFCSRIDYPKYRGNWVRPLKSVFVETLLYVKGIQRMNRCILWTVRSSVRKLSTI